MICVRGERAFFRAIIENFDAERIFFGREADGNFGCSRVMERMKDRLLDDAIGVEGRLGARAGQVSRAMNLTRKGIFHPARETFDRGP